MNKKNINKIVLVSLCDKFSNQLSVTLSETLDMLFCDTVALVEYELVDKKALEELCSVQYLKTCEKRVMKHIASFENVVVSIPYEYLVRSFDTLKNNAVIVFVELSKSYVSQNSNALDIICYKERTEELKKLADVCITLRKTDIDFALKKVMEVLGGLL